mgnify:CR=1 FL=1
MKRIVCLLSAVSAAVSLTPMNLGAQSNRSSLSEEQFEYEVSRRGQIRYWLYLPQGYAAGTERAWPLLLFLHGAGERGSDLQRVTIHGPPKLVRQGTNFPFVLVAPQCPEGQRWEAESLLKLLDHVVKTHAVDPARVYVTGLSMGGYGTWKLALAAPERFAAAVPICGGGERIDVLLASRERLQALQGLAVWAFHGAKDPVVPLEESERMVSALKKAGVAEVKLTVYPEAQHDSWTATYSNPELYDWLLAHRRGGLPPKP